MADHSKSRTRHRGTNIAGQIQRSRGDASLKLMPRVYTAGARVQMTQNVESVVDEMWNIVMTVMSIFGA